MERGAVRAQSGLIVVVLTLAIAAIAFFNALRVGSALVQTSDSAQGFVVGYAIATGNTLLSGWHFPIDNFYFTDSLPYAAAELIAGPRPYLMQVVPAVVYAIFVALALLACIRTTSSFSKNMESLAATALLLAAPARIGAWNPMLMSDMHTATSVVALAALMLCAYVVRLGSHDRVSFTYAAGLVLVVCAAVASDPFSVVFAFGPAAAVLAFESVRGRDGQNVRFAIVAIVAGVAAGLLLPLIVARIGGFTVENDVAFRFSPAEQWWTNFIDVLFSTLALWGVNPVDVHNARDALIFGIRCVGLLLVVSFIANVVHNLVRRQEVPLLDKLLGAGVLVLLPACVVSAQFAKGVRAETIWQGGPPMRFLVPAILFSATLSVRQISGVFDAVRNTNRRFFLRGALVLLAVIAVAIGTWQSASRTAQPRMGQTPSMTSARWLASRSLSQGVGEYWSANLVTAMSGNTVAVRSVVPDQGRLVPYVWVEDRRFYAAPPLFVIWHEPNQTGVTEALVRASYPVCTVDLVAGYRIAVLKSRAKPVSCS